VHFLTTSAGGFDVYAVGSTAVVDQACLDDPTPRLQRGGTGTTTALQLPC
jgi:hypothetical protein